MKSITMIAAVGLNNEIGANNQLLWHFKKDMKFFKDNTLGKPVVMGRKTFESLPGLLPKRTHIVITKQPITIPKVIIANSKEEIFDWQKYFDEIVIIGGASIYNMLLEDANKLLITKVHRTYPNADAFFPQFNETDFEKIIIKKEYENDTLLEFTEYTRKLVKKN